MINCGKQNMRGKQKTRDLIEDVHKRKKIKLDPVCQDNLVSEVEILDDIKPQFLDNTTIQEGLVILGCVTYIGKSSIHMSLPGCLYGIVEARNLSNGFTKAVQQSAISPDLEVPPIESVVKLGMILPCKILRKENEDHKKIQISLSIKPEDVNGNLKSSSIYSKMGLFVSVQSIEDHGYIVDVGTNKIQGFLPTENVCSSEKLKVGQLISVYVEKIWFCNKKLAKVTFHQVASHQQFPTVPLGESIKLHSIIPGNQLIARIVKKHKHYVIMKCFDYDACSSLFYHNSHKHLEIGDEIQGTVLYVNPITHIIHLSLNDLPSPADFSNYFNVKKFETINLPRFLHFYKNKAIYRFGSRKFAFINVWDLPRREGTVVSEPSLVNTNILKASIIAVHYMDNVVQLTAKPSTLARNMIPRQDVKAGDIFDVIVEKHEDGGMFVRICPGILGFVRKLHMSDAYITKSEQLFRAGSTIKCRVLCNYENGKIFLTCKKSLVELPTKHVLSSYFGARCDHLYKGVVVNIYEEYILVLFFNDVKGIIKRENMPLSRSVALNTIYFIGQTITCKVLHCNAKERKLNLLHMVGGLCSNEKDISNSSSKKYMNKISKKLQLNQVSYKKQMQSSTMLQTVDFISKEDWSAIANEPSYKMDVLKKSSKAIVRKVKSHQLSISLENSNGRVHITGLGCMTEGVYPLKKFTCGQEIDVYIIGVQKKTKFPDVTRKNFATINECTLSIPPSSNFTAGDSVIGFVKEVHDIYATIWLTPNIYGVLDYLHYSENPKVIRKIHQYLKVGLSLSVSILEIKDSMKNNNDKVFLNKIDYYRPEIGVNVLGLVQVSCPIRGLTMKLPFGYHGHVSVTDLSDVYQPVHYLFKKYQSLKFLHCHVLHVDHYTKYCILSLRTSRLYHKEKISDNFCPELTLCMIKNGVKVKGYVKHVSNSSVTVLIGRDIEGKVNLHECSLFSCKVCKKSKEIANRYCVGTIIEAIIQGKFAEQKFILSLPELETKKSICDILPVKEDISFDISDSVVPPYSEDIGANNLDAN